MVGEILDCDPVLDKDATKQKFLQEVQDAAVVHIGESGLRDMLDADNDCDTVG
jgi:hypothetical protein